MLEIHFDRRSRWLIRVEQIGSRFVVSLLREFNFKMKQILQHVFICLRVKFSRETNNNYFPSMTAESSRHMVIVLFR